MLGAEIGRKGTLGTKLKTLIERAQRRVQAGIQATAETLYAASIELVPVDIGALRKSSRVRVVGAGFYTVAFVGYGVRGQEYFGFSEKEQRYVTRVPYDYAVYVHEIPRPHDPGMHDFLRTPRNTELPAMRQAFNTAAHAA